MRAILKSGCRFGASRILTFLCLIVSQGCDSNDSNEQEDTSSNDSEDTSSDKLEWESCPTGYADGRAGFLCTIMNMPINHADPEGEQIEVLVYKYEGKAESKKGQIWFLMGGPGDSNIAFIDPIEVFAEAFPDWDYYSVEHRGVGASTRLSCPEEIDGAAMDTAACGEHLLKTYGERLAFFSTTQAAYDVGTAIDRVREETQPLSTFIYSVSYGTHWAQRYLQLFPEQVSGVILDSTCPPGYCPTDTMDIDFDQVGRELMEVCAGDETCNSKMSTVAQTPIDTVAAVFQRIDDGELCEPLRDIVTRKALRNVLGTMVADWQSRIGIPPLIDRIARCNEQDVSEVKYFLGSMQEETEENGLDSYILGMHIDLSEFGYSTPLSVVEETEDSLFFSPDWSLDGATAAANGWPVYGDDGYMKRAAKTDIPILILQGDLDPQTTYDRALAAGDNFNGRYQYFFTFPEVPHVVVVNSQTEESLQKLANFEIDFLLYTCGSQVFWSFIQNPDERPSDECMDSLYKIDFNNESFLSQVVAAAMFDSERLWGGD